MRIGINAVLAALAVTLLVAGTVLAAHHEEEAAIKSAVFDYFHGQGTADGERLHRAFATEHASMVGVSADDDGREEIRSYKDMLSIVTRWSQNENPPGADRDGEIIAMEVVDGRLAVVLFRYTDVFYDALTLARVNGEWKIIQKAFIRQDG